MATHNMTGETLISMNMTTMRAQGPSSWGPPSKASAAGHEHENQHEHSNSVQPNTTSIVTPIARKPLPHPVSPLSSSVSQRELEAASQVSPISAASSGPSATLFGAPKPSSISAPPERGTAISVAGSEAKIVSIPARGSRPLTGSNGAAGGRAARATPVQSQYQQGPHKRISSDSATLRPAPLSVRRSRGPPPVSLRAQQQLSVNTNVSSVYSNYSNGGFQAYHPSMGNMAAGLSPASAARRGSVGSLSGVSIASSDVMSPVSMNWPMPPRTPTGPNQHR